MPSLQSVLCPCWLLCSTQISHLCRRQQQAHWDITCHCSQQNKDGFTAAGAVPLLTALLTPDLPAVQEASAGTFCNLAPGHWQHTRAMVAAGAVPLLVALLRPNQPLVQRTAAGALPNLAVNSQLNTDAKVAAGAVPLFVAMLKSDQLAAQAAAAAAAAAADAWGA